VLKWNDFEIIISIQETQTLSSAARRLGLNQSTISRILKRIETELGHPVFSSESGLYELTPEGEPYFHVGKKMEGAASALQNLSPQSSIRGTVRLTTVEALVGYLLTRISGFSLEYPGISVELNGSNQNVSLSQRGFHAALRLHREENGRSLLTKKVGELAISGYQRRAGTPSSQWIGYEATLASIPEEKWLRMKTGKKKQSLHVSSYATMETAIAQGLGSGLLPRFMGDQNPELQRMTGNRSVLTRPVWFISYPESRRDPAVHSFSTWIFKQFEKDRLFLGGSNSVAN
jgi:DNA-binding transcriptional LysR family regulator